MKARTVREMILLYHLNEEMPKGGQLRKLAENMGIKAVTIAEKDLGQKLGALALSGHSSETTESYSGPAPQDELMIFCGFSRSCLDRFLSRCRQEGIEPVSLKAVLTEHNREWKVIDLFSELKKEHELFEKYHRLQQLLQAANGLNGEKKIQADRLAEKCKIAMEKNEPDIKELSSLADQLEALTD